jgi:hypothetical protein
MARIVHAPAAEGDLLEIWVGLAANNPSEMYVFKGI